MQVALLAYPDNPVGTVFIQTFIRQKVPICCVIVEEKNQSANWRRSVQKMKRDGFWTTLYRVFQIVGLKIMRRTVVHLAEKNRIPVHRVPSFNSQECELLISDMNIDILAIASAPILKPRIFTQAEKGCLNAHPGWLPEYRGLGANAYALKDGKLPGISIHFIDEGIDTGPIIVREKIPLLPHDTVARVNDRAVARGAVLMTDVIKKIENESLQIPLISESKGKNYSIMPYSMVRKINKRIKKDFHAFQKGLTD